MKPNLISVFEMRSWPATWAPQDFFPLLSSSCSPAPETSAELLMASSTLWWHLDRSVSHPQSLHAMLHSTGPRLTVTIYGAASNNDGKMNSHSLKTFSPGKVMDWWRVFKMIFSVQRFWEKGLMFNAVSSVGKESPCGEEFMQDPLLTGTATHQSCVLQALCLGKTRKLVLRCCSQSCRFVDCC